MRLQVDYIVADSETTGLDPKVDRLCEIAAVHPGGGGYSSLVDPGIPVPPQSSAVHHLTDDDVRGAPSAAYALREVTHGYVPRVIVAHNAAFDSSFIDPVATEVWPDHEPQWLCTWRIALHLWPDSPGHSVQVLRYYLKLRVDLPTGLAPHRALYDALVTHATFLKMLEDHTLEDLLVLQHRPVLLRTVGFGKHRGEPWASLPRDYLRWILSQDFDADAKYTARHYLS